MSPSPKLTFRPGILLLFYCDSPSHHFKTIGIYQRIKIQKNYQGSTDYIYIGER